MAYIYRTSFALPPVYYDQEMLTGALIKYWGEDNPKINVVQRLHQNMHIEGRYMAYPTHEYIQMDTFKKRNDAYIEAALQLAEETLQTLFMDSNIEATNVSAMLFTSVTGLAVPSIDARLMNRLNFSPHLKRMPVFGLGCLAGAAGVSRLTDYLEGHPNEAAILLAVEICSTTIQKNDISVANFIASGLFGDGACAVLMLGDQHPLVERHRHPRAIACQSTFFPDTENVMGWDFSSQGFKIVLSADVPRIAEQQLRGCIETLLSPHRLTLSDIRVWIAHPGGPKVIDAMEKGLGLNTGTFDNSRTSLKKFGNMSSVSVLAILHETLRDTRIEPGSYGIMLAMGPGFCAEAILLQWS
jgi:alkylresorcinol/alkylpyrone synthase